jgi:hypothetical protein
MVELGGEPHRHGKTIGLVRVCHGLLRSTTAAGPANRNWDRA